jgi:hypothetical protein
MFEREWDRKTEERLKRIGNGLGRKGIVGVITVVFLI